MSSTLRLVRCPFCARRFNITGAVPGTRLRCGYCTAVLVVPAGPPATSRFRFSRAAVIQVSAGAAALLLAAGVLFWAVGGTAAPPAAPAVAARPVPPAPAEPRATEVDPPSITDELSRLKQDIIDDFGNGMLWHTGVKPYLVALEPSPRYVEDQVLEEYGRRLKTLQEAFHREIAAPLGLPAVADTLAVVVLNSRPSFDRYFKGKLSPAIKGIYEYDRRRVVVYHDITVPYEVLFHEGAHQLVDYHGLRETGGQKRRSTLYWLQEGIGTYFEGFRQKPDGTITVDLGANGGRLATLKQALQQRGMKDFIPLTVLARMTVDEFWDWYERGQGQDPEETTRRAQLYYAESWAFITFLRHRPEGPLREILHEVLRAEISGRAPKDLFERLLRERTGQELADLNQEFIDFILGLR
ncbi:MAG TPA: DUF1570 domain-containing protein [Planctomycetota bacterium]|nr:DUF1570 domain-containing protein [Planctomycetota bacterium]